MQKKTYNTETNFDDIFANTVNSLKINTLDIEASGIHPESYPIEIGIVLKSGESWCSLIKPDNSWQHWDKSAEKIHGISRSDLQQYGKPISEVTQHLNQLLNRGTVYCDCWSLDSPWLLKLFHQAKAYQDFKLLDIMYVVSEEQYENLNQKKPQIAQKLKLDRHRASNDARILQLAYEEVKSISQ